MAAGPVLHEGVLSWSATATGADALGDVEPPTLSAEELRNLYGGRRHSPPARDTRELDVRSPADGRPRSPSTRGVRRSADVGKPPRRGSREDAGSRLEPAQHAGGAAPGRLTSDQPLQPELAKKRP